MKTVVANFMRHNNVPLPVEESQCANAFDQLVFLAVPIMAVLKMLSPISPILGHGVAFGFHSASGVIDSQSPSADGRAEDTKGMSSCIRLILASF